MVGYEICTHRSSSSATPAKNLVERFGDKPATRYQEGTIDMQQTEHFHYRPLWDPDHEIFDPYYSAAKLTDPYSYLDPRKYTTSEDAKRWAKWYTPLGVGI